MRKKRAGAEKARRRQSAVTNFFSARTIGPGEVRISWCLEEKPVLTLSVENSSISTMKGFYIDGGFHYGESFQDLLENGKIEPEWDKIGFEPNPHIQNLPAWVHRAALSDIDGEVDFYPQNSGSNIDGQGSSTLPDFVELLDRTFEKQMSAGERFLYERKIKVLSERLLGGW
jgi:hypothetical protein